MMHNASLNALQAECDRAFNALGAVSKRIKDTSSKEHGCIAQSVTAFVGLNFAEGRAAASRAATLQRERKRLEAEQSRLVDEAILAYAHLEQAQRNVQEA